MKLIFFIIIISVSSIVYCADTIYVDSSFEREFINVQADVLIDSTDLLTIDSVSSSEYINRFKPHNKKSFNFGMGGETIWLRFLIDVNPEIKHRKQVVITLDKSIFPYVNIYIPMTSGKYNIYSSSYLERSDSGTLNYRYPVFVIPQELQNNKYIYLRIEPYIPGRHASANFNLQVFDKEFFMRLSWRDNLFFGLVFGILLSMLLYNLSLTFFLKDKLYLLYFIYIGFVLVYQFFRSGFNNILGISQYPAGILIIVGLALVFALLFTQSFLMTSKYCLILHRIIWGFIGLTIFNILLQITGFAKTANSMLHLLGIIIPIVSLIAGIIRIKDGFIPAQYFLAAWIVLIIGVACISLVGMGILPNNMITTNALSIGTTLEAVLLSTALAQRIRLLRKEKKELQYKEKQLTELAIRDELTGLFNKRWYNNSIQKEIRKSRASANSLSLILLDVDHFKSLNDKYGHDIGDIVLEKLGHIILSCIRDCDIPCRYGGEEFAIILPNADSSTALKVAERLRAAFELHPFDTNNDVVIFSTISLGVSTNNDIRDEFILFKSADKALYKAKEEGRNRVVIAE